MAVSNSSLLDTATALFVNDAIDESEFIAVYDQTNRKSPEFQYWNYETWLLAPTKIHRYLPTAITLKLFFYICIM